MAEVWKRINIHLQRRRGMRWLSMMRPWGVAAALAVFLGALTIVPREGVAQEGERGRPAPTPEAPVTRPEPTPGFDLIEPPAPEPLKPHALFAGLEPPAPGAGIGPAGPVAATVAYTSGNVITFIDLPDFAHTISVQWDYGSLSYYFYSASALTAGLGCTQVNSYTASCYAPTAVTINMSMGTGAADSDDQVAVYDLDAADTLGMTGGAGNDLLQVGSFGNIDGFGPTSFAGQGGSDALFVVDLFNPTGSSYGVESTYVQRSGVNANYYDSTVEAVALETSASDDFTYVSSTSASTQVTIYGNSGNDTVYLGTNFELDSLPGPIFVDGEDGTDDIEVYDHGSLYSGLYGITYNGVSRAGFGGLAYSGDNEGLTLLAAEGANTFNVTSSNIWTPVTIYAGAGDDVFNVGPDLDAIQSKVRTHGGADVDVLLVDESASTDTDPITLNGAMFSRPNSGGVEFAEVEGLTLEGQPLGANVFIDNVGVPLTANTNAGDDNIFIFGGSAQVTVNAGAGNDGVIWGDGDLDSAPPAAVNAGPGSDHLFMDDDLVSYGDNYFIDSSTFYRDFSNLLVYTDFEQFYLQAEYGPNFFYVDGTDAGVPYYINARGGNDSALVGVNDGNIDDILGTIVFSGEGDLDSLYVIDSALVTGETYFVRGGRIERTGGPADIDYTPDTELAQLQAGASGDTINLVGTAFGSSTDIYGNAGNDTVSVFAAGLATSGGARLFGGANSDQLTLYRGGLDSTLSAGLITTVGRHDVQHFDFESTATQFSGDDTDLDGCPDAKEAGLNPLFGGDRDPHDYADWFDVTGDKAIDVADVVSILGFFGAAPGVSQLHDRAVGAAPKLFRTKQANNGIDVADAIANLQAFGHNCT